MRALIELKKECFNRVTGSFCICCENDNPRQLVLHHLSYNENSITYNKFENNDDGRLKYYSCLLDEIKKDHNNFLVLCIECHGIIEKLLKMEWIDAYNWICENNEENGMYYNAWNQTIEKRRINKQIGLDDVNIISPKPTELESFFW